MLKWVFLGAKKGSFQDVRLIIANELKLTYKVTVNLFYSKKISIPIPKNKKIVGILKFVRLWYYVTLGVYNIF